MNIELRGVTYQIEEASVGEMMPIMDLMQSDMKQFQYELTKRVVKVDGVPIGEELSQLPMSVYLDLLTNVMEAQGYGTDDEGKS